MKTGTILSPLSDYMTTYLAINFKQPKPTYEYAFRSYTNDLKPCARLTKLWKKIEVNAILNETDANVPFELLMSRYNIAFDSHFQPKKSEKYPILSLIPLIYSTVKINCFKNLL